MNQPETDDLSTRIIRHERPQQRRLEQSSLPSVDGFNASEFSLSPLSRQTSHMAGDSVRHEWYQQLDGEEVLRYFQLSYGDVVPNSLTEDVLLILAHLANEADDPLRIRTSLYEIHKLQGYKSHPNQKEINRIVDHLEALMRTFIKTNALYKRESKEWVGISTNVVSGYEFKDATGEVKRRKIEFVNEKGRIEKQTRVVRELNEINLSAQFYDHFLRDSIPIDLGTYFNLGMPTSKRIYRFGNKYVRTYGHHRIDLMQFCMSRIGMSPLYVEKHKPSYLASKIRPHVKRVCETGEMHVRLEKSRNTTSGYVIVFEHMPKQLPLGNFGESYTKAEEQAARSLKQQGIFPNVAAQIIRRTRKALGRQGPAYIKFVIRKFKTDYINAGKLKVAASNYPGVLRRCFKEDWFYPEFYEFQSKREKKERREEAERYRESNPSDPILKTLDAVGASLDVNAPRGAFAIEQFKAAHPEVYAKVEKHVEEKYSASSLDGLELDKKHLQGMRDNALKVYCAKIDIEFTAGNMNYFPDALLPHSQE